MRVTSETERHEPADISGSARKALVDVVGLSVRRQWYGTLVAVTTLPLATAGLAASREHLSQAMIFLLYLSLVIVLAAIGGPVVGMISAAVAFLMVNWYFIEPLHTLDVADAERVTELVIFLAVSGTVAALASTATRRTRERDTQTETSERLRAANELRSALLRAVSHDLRTPLATAKIATSSLRSTDVEWDESTRQELLETADDEIDRLIRIVENLLDASRLQTGIVTATPMDVAVAPTVEAALATLGVEERTRVDVVVPGEIGDVLADRALLERVIANLVTNALAADPGGRVQVVAVPSADASMETISLQVIDSGPGIPLDRRETVFLPFQRFTDSSTANGLGLGLAICLGFCEAMNTPLRLAETPGGGTTVAIELAVVR